MSPAIDSKVSLTLDFNDVRTFWQMFDTLCGDGFELDEQHSAVTEADPPWVCWRLC